MAPLGMWTVSFSLTGHHVERVALHAEGDLGDAFDHRPVLGAVGVLLQRQAGAGIDDDALDLMAAALIERLVVAPGPVVADEIAIDGLRRRLDGGGQLLDPVGSPREATRTASSVATTTTSLTPTTPTLGRLVLT